MLKKLASNSFIRGSAIFAAASFAANVIAYVGNLLIARNFSLGDYGEYMAAQAYLAILTVGLTAFTLIVIKRIGSVRTAQRHQVAKSVESWLIYQTKTYSWLIIIFAVILGIIIWRLGNISIVSTIFIFASLVTALFTSLYRAYFQAYKAFITAGLFVILGTILRLAGATTAILFSPTLIFIYSAFVGAGFLMLILERRVALPKDIKPAKIKLDSFYGYLKRRSILLPIAASLGLLAIVNADVILVKGIFNPDQAGYYGALSLLSKIILYVCSPVSLVAFSFFTGHESKNSQSKILIISSLGFILIGLISIVGYWLFPELIINMIFGSRYLNIQSLVVFAGIFGAIYALITLFTQYLIAQDSIWSLSTLLMVAIQMGAILVWHATLSSVLLINIISSTLLLLMLFIGILRTRSAAYANQTPIS